MNEYFPIWVFDLKFFLAPGSFLIQSQFLSQVEEEMQVFLTYHRFVNLKSLFQFPFEGIHFLIASANAFSTAQVRSWLIADLIC